MLDNFNIEPSGLEFSLTSPQGTKHARPFTHKTSTNMSKNRGEGWDPTSGMEPDEVGAMVSTMELIFEEACEITTIGLALLELGGWNLFFKYQPILNKIHDSGQDGYLCYQRMQGGPFWEEHKETIKTGVLLRLRPLSQRAQQALASKQEAFDIVEQLQPGVVWALSLQRP